MHQKNTRSRKLSITISVCTIAVLLMWWNPQGLLSPARNVLTTILHPVQKIFFVSTQKIQSITRVITEIGSIKKQNNTLKDEVAKLKVENARLATIEEENKHLRAEIGLKEKEAIEAMAVEVIGADSQSQGDWILINKGNNVDIKEEAIVMSKEGVYLGKVEEVFPTSARVMLATNTQSTVGAIVAGKNIKGIVKGEYGLSMKFSLVLQSEQLEKGDVVVTSGNNNETPEGLLLGTVQDVHQSDDALFLGADLISQVDISQLRIAYVISKQQK
ncbi:MAG: rod shape-determining protein MreC [Candidatus Moranbacteria bacterium]|nr:rod shape-determining protein MreC [Candidatus Moranbacteria bacterium]